jgi:hypothetical protein
VGSRSADGDYLRFVEATLGLADAAAGLPRRARLGMAVALLTVFESDRVARCALVTAEPQRMRRAAAGLQQAREVLAEADTDARRRCTLSLVA